MDDSMNVYHALPGQNINSALITDWPAGQPYKGAPWNHNPGYNTGNAFGDPPQTIPYPSGVVDWVLVQVRKNGRLPADSIWNCAGWVHTDGTVTFPEACPWPVITPSDSFFIVVQHRTHLGVMSKYQAQKFCGNSYIYNDFTLTDSYRPFAFRVGEKHMPDGKWAMYTGNGEQVSSIAAINSADHTLWKTHQGKQGYWPSDYSMNVITNSGDETIWKLNQNKTTAVIFY